MRLHVNVLMNVNGARQPRSTAGERKSPETLRETKYFIFPNINSFILCTA